MQIDSLRDVGQWAVAQPSMSPTERIGDGPEIIQAVKAVTEAGLFGEQYELTFAMDRSSRRSLLRLVNRDTREVVTQIPAEYILRLAQDLNGSFG